MTREKRTAVWLPAIACLCIAGAAVSAWAATQPIISTELENEVARELLKLAWAACAALLAGMGILIGVVWTQLNRRLKLDEDATRACFDETAKKVDLGTFATFERRFYDHEREDRLRHEAMMKTIGDGQREVTGMLLQLINKKG